MSVSLVGTPQFSATASSTTLTITLPSGIQSGDRIILLVGNGEDSPTPSITTAPSGYTEVGSLNGFDYGAAGIYTNCYHKTAGSSESNPSITWNTGASNGGGLYALAVVYRSSVGWHPSDPVTLTSSGNSSGLGTSSSPQPPNTTTTHSNVFLVQLLQTSDDNTVSLGTANGWTQNGTGASTLGSDASMTVASRLVASPTEQASPIYSLTGGPDHYSWRTIRLRENVAETRSVGQASETDTGLSAMTRKKQKAIGQPSETDTGGALTEKKNKLLGQPSETDTAQVITPQVPAADRSDAEVSGLGLGNRPWNYAFHDFQIVSVGQVTETNTAQQFTVEQGGGQIIPVGQAMAENNIAQAIGKKKQKGVGQASETNTAQVVIKDRFQADVSGIGVTNRPGYYDFVANRSKQIAVGQAAETNPGRSMGKLKRKGIGQASETNTATTLLQDKLIAVGQAIETNSLFPLADRILANQASETDTSGVLGKKKVKGIGLITETNTAQTLVVFGSILIGQAVETDTANPVGKRKKHFGDEAIETNSAQSLGKKKTRLLGQITETNTSQAIGKAKKKAIGQSLETDTALPFNNTVISVGQAVETNTSRPVAIVGPRPNADVSGIGPFGFPWAYDFARNAQYIIAVNTATDVHTSLTITKRKAKGISQSQETDTGQIVTPRSTYAIGQASETDSGFALSKAKVKGVNQSVETDTAQSLGGGRKIPVTIVAEADTAQAFTKHRKYTLGIAIETNTGLSPTKRKQKAIGQPSETDTATQATIRKGRNIGQVVETDTAFNFSVGGVVQFVIETNSAIAIGKRKVKQIGQATNTDSAQIVRPSRGKVLNQAFETNVAQAFTVKLPQGYLLKQVIETVSARPIRWAPKHRLVNPALEAESADSITGYKATPTTTRITWG